MNREEAVIIIKKCKDKGFKHTFYTLDEYHTALDMAVQALEQKPCEDAISRTEAIRVASGYCHWSNIPDELAKLPSVSTEKTGRWEEYGTRQVQILPTYRCSVCGEEYLQSEHFKYCPNCGAKMQEVEE